MSYQVQRGDTISKVTSILKTDWQTLKELNPHAVGRSSRTGNWFVREGAVLKGRESFSGRLDQSLEAQKETGSRPDPFKPPALTKQKAAGEVYTVQPGDTLWEIAVKRFRVNLDDLIRINNIQNPDSIQPGQDIRIPDKEKPGEKTVVASWYGESYHGRPMACGEFYNMYADTIAHRDLPFGTRVELTNPETGERVKAVVTDRGPFVEGRDVDLSYGLARKLSMVEKGVGVLRMRVL